MVVATRLREAREFDQSVGETLRDARLRLGLSRQEVAGRASGRLTSTAIGGYERGERAITLDRFVEFALAIGVPPEELLGDALERADPAERHEITIDLTRLEQAGASVRQPVAEFAHGVRVHRRDYLTQTVTLRSGDLAAMARRAGTDPKELIRRLAPAVVRRSDQEE
jgi:transcriptional regulator with XRE-family HTH domain